MVLRDGRRHAEREESMKMAKASQADLDMAMDLASALSALGQTWNPTLPEAISEANERFDIDNDADCALALRYLLDLADRGSLERVVYGMAVLLDPRNKCVDPDADTLERHPEVEQCRQENEQLKLKLSAAKEREFELREMVGRWMNDEGWTQADIDAVDNIDAERESQ